MPAPNDQTAPDNAKTGRWTVFGCTNYAELAEGLVAALGRLSAKPRSVRDLAALLGHSSPAAIHAMIQGQRLLSVQVQRRIGVLLGLSAQEAHYVQEWVAYERQRRSGHATQADWTRLQHANLQQNHREQMATDRFAYVADWFHLPLKALISIAGFRFNLDWIQARLKGKPSSQQLIYSLQVLEQLRLVKRVGRSWGIAKNITTPDVPSEAIRRHHVQMMERAMEALVEETLDCRDLSSTTFVFAPKRLSEAKAAIEEFREEFLRRFEGTDSGEVFQMNIQLFPHTRPVPKKKRS